MNVPRILRIQVADEYRVITRAGWGITLTAISKSNW
jgi:hypothetical protein